MGWALVALPYFALSASASSLYAPKAASCPIDVFHSQVIPLVRPAAAGINAQEAVYVQSRKTKADVALAAWLSKHGSFSTTSQPTLGFSSSGGGYRAMLITAGVVQALDGRETADSTVAGLYQAFTYEAGLSGGSWFLGSLAGNDWPTISSLQATHWSNGLATSALDPANLLNNSARYDSILSDLQAKQTAGYETSLVDAYGLALGFALLSSADGGASATLSGLAGLSNFTSHDVPFPIITARGVDDAYTGGCGPLQNSTDYEFTPYEYGSWDTDVAAFAKTATMGTPLVHGRPQVIGRAFNHAWRGQPCVKGFDRLDLVMGTSSDVFNILCSAVQPANSSSAGIWADLSGMVATTHTPRFEDIFANFPNPFYAYPASPRLKMHETLFLADGGEAGQNVPMWPFLAPSKPGSSTSARAVDVLVVTDSSADTAASYPDGTALYDTSLAAGNASDPSYAARMPHVPDPATFLAQGLGQRPVFFGCNATSANALMIVYLPNYNLTYSSGQSTFKVVYTDAEQKGMLANGNAIARQVSATDGKVDEQWPFCLACAIKTRTAGGVAAADSLPAECNACFAKYCFYKEGTSGG